MPSVKMLKISPSTPFVLLGMVTRSASLEYYSKPIIRGYVLAERVAINFRDVHCLGTCDVEQYTPPN